jgi:hypothetical protein
VAVDKVVVSSVLADVGVEQVGEGGRLLRVAQRLVEGDGIEVTVPFLRLALVGEIEQLVADHPPQVGHRRRPRIELELAAGDDPVRQAFLHQVVEGLALQASGSSPELHDQFRGDRHLPSFQSTAIPARHRACRSSCDGRGNER